MISVNEDFLYITLFIIIFHQVIIVAKAGAQLDIRKIPNMGQKSFRRGQEDLI